MAHTPDMANCVGGDNGLGELLPLSPYSALSYHFGMLLGVDDFETEQAYHRAKHRLHNAWLHREGVVWGFDVVANDDDKEKGEIRVTSGLALDAGGHELHLEADACLNLAKWLEKHDKDPNLEVETNGDEKKIKRAHVVIRFKACLTRQVPALMEPCNNAGTGTAYSRVFETVEILMIPGPPPVKDPPYHLLRLLFGLEAAETEEGGAVKANDQAVLDALAAIAALPDADRPPALMAAFHRFAALDEIALTPAKSEDDARVLLFPGRDDEPVVLADITDLTLQKKNGNWILTSGNIDTSVRPSHVATTTIQDLLCGPAFGAAAASPGSGAAGPQVDRASLKFVDAATIEFLVDKNLQPETVKPAGFSVSTFDSANGWQVINVDKAGFDPETKTVTVALGAKMTGRVRLIVSGTGPTPLLGDDLVPLAGEVGGPAGTEHDGHDFVHMQDAEGNGASKVEEPDAQPDSKASKEATKARRGRK
jgi:hypothetical protein